MIKKEEFYKRLGNGKNKELIGEPNLYIKKAENSKYNKKIIKKIFISENKVKIYRKKYY